MKSKPVQKVIIYIFISIFSLTSLLPFVWVLLTSLKNSEQIFDVNQIIPTSVTLWNYYNVIVKANFFMYFNNSVIVAVCTTLISMLLSISAAYGLTRYNILFGNKLKMGILYSRMFPAVLLSLPYYIIMRKIGLSDTLLGLILIYCSFVLPFCIWNTQTYFSKLPWDLEEAACIDGAGRVRAFFMVMFPLARPGILATSLYAFLMSWDEFMFANLFITSDTKKTVQLGVQSFIGEYSTDWGSLMAAAMISLIPVIIFFSFVQKNLVGGLTTGAVKG